jgi:hypothetical protein
MKYCQGKLYEAIQKNGTHSSSYDGSRPMLLTGSHRSGTTWVGKIISASNSVGYIMEPFNISHPRPGLVGVNFDYWFQYINHENGSLYYEPIKKMLGFRYDFTAGLKAVRSTRDFAKLVRDFYNSTKYRLTGVRPTVKEPTAIFLAPWFAESFDADIIVLIRHPAAFISSLKILGWHYPFSQFLRQTALMRDYLGPFEEEIKAYAKTKQDIIDQAILLWKIVHFTIRLYQQKYKQWIYLRHEDLSSNPLPEFRKVFSRLDIDFDNSVRKCIDVYSSITNPSDTTRAGLLLQTSRAIKRDSKKNILNWKKRLSEAEIEYIHNQVEYISRDFYSDSEW